MRLSAAPALVTAMVLGAVGIACSSDGEGDGAERPAATFVLNDVCESGLTFFETYGAVLVDSEQITAKQAAELHDELDPGEQMQWEVRDEGEPVAKCLMRFDAEVVEGRDSGMRYVLIAEDGTRAVLPAPDVGTA